MDMNTHIIPKITVLLVFCLVAGRTATAQTGAINKGTDSSDAQAERLLESKLSVFAKATIGCDSLYFPQFKNKIALAFRWYRLRDCQQQSRLYQNIVTELSYGD